MREIKFRGKSSSWHYGDLIHDSCNGHELIFIDNNAERTRHSVDKDTVGQFTGLLDSNGQEIYEGDIVTFGQGTEPSAVRWDNEFAYFVIMKSLLLGHACKAVRVIGNVHDNPNLMEAAHD